MPKPLLHGEMALSLPPPILLLMRLLLHALVLVLVLPILVFLVAHRSNSNYLIGLSVEGDARY